MTKRKNFFRTLLDKYDALCKDLGVDQGGCRGCVPVVKFDEDSKSTDTAQNAESKPKEKES